MPRDLHCSCCLRPSSRRRNSPGRRRSSSGANGAKWQPEISYLLIASFLSGCVFFALEIIWIHLVGAVVGGSIYAFSWMLTSVLIGLWVGSWIANRSKGIRPAKVFLLCAFALLIQLSAWPLAPALFAIAPDLGRHWFLHARALPIAGGLRIDCSVRLFARPDLSNSAQQPAAQSRRKRMVRWLFECRELDRLPGRSAAFDLRINKPARLGIVAEGDHSHSGRALAYF